MTATLGTQYAATIAPFKRAKNGRAALLALKAQFAGPAFWDSQVAACSTFMMNTVWRGTTSFTLHSFLAKHRASFNTMQRCAEHVSVELPNKRTRVGYLLDNVDCNNKDVTTALSHICLDNGPNGMRGDFERAVAFLLPTNPVKRKRVGGKRDSAQISAAEGMAPKKKTSFKPNIGKTGVELRYYKTKDYKKLNDKQKEELKMWRLENSQNANKSNKGGDGSKSSGMSKADVAALIHEHDKKK